MCVKNDYKDDKMVN